MSILYSDKLKRKFWDGNKGKIAKAAGETGMGEALGTLERGFGAIAWDAIDTKPPGQQNYTPKSWQDALDTALGACEAQSVVKARLAALDVKHTAELTVKKFKDSKLKLLISKDDVKRTQEIADAADQLVGMLDPAAMKKGIQSTFDQVKTLAEGSSKAYVEMLRDSVKKAIVVLTDMTKNMTVDNFNSKIQLAARGVHTQLDKAGSLGRGAVDEKKAKALSATSKDWAAGSVTVKSEAELKQEYMKLRKYLQEVNELVAHH